MCFQTLPEAEARGTNPFHFIWGFPFFFLFFTLMREQVQTDRSSSSSSNSILMSNASTSSQFSISSYRRSLLDAHLNKPFAIRLRLDSNEEHPLHIKHSYNLKHNQHESAGEHYLVVHAVGDGLT